MFPHLLYQLSTVYFQPAYALSDPHTSLFGYHFPPRKRGHKRIVMRAVPGFGICLDSTRRPKVSLVALEAGQCGACSAGREAHGSWLSWLLFKALLPDQVQTWVIQFRVCSFHSFLLPLPFILSLK